MILLRRYKNLESKKHDARSNKISATSFMDDPFKPKNYQVVPSGHAEQGFPWTYSCDPIRFPPIPQLQMKSCFPNLIEKNIHFNNYSNSDFAIELYFAITKQFQRLKINIFLQLSCNQTMQHYPTKFSLLPPLPHM